VGALAGRVVLWHRFDVQISTPPPLNHHPPAHPPPQACNHPALLDPAAAAAAAPGGDARAPALSGKAAALAALLAAAAVRGGERVVVVSQSTAMLDVAGAICAGLGLATARLDGGTDVSKRQDLVNAFNRHGVGQVFLLSTAAGGAGLNLVGASRLVLYDSHWCALALHFLSCIPRRRSAARRPNLHE
jgi:SNF2 family DNA or RNA helicase